MIAEGVLAIEYGASSEDIARTTHAHVRTSLNFVIIHQLHRIYPFFY